MNPRASLQYRTDVQWSRIWSGGHSSHHQNLPAQTLWSIDGNILFQLVAIFEARSSMKKSRGDSLQYSLVHTTWESNSMVHSQWLNLLWRFPGVQSLGSDGLPHSFIKVVFPLWRSAWLKLFNRVASLGTTIQRPTCLAFKCWSTWSTPELRFAPQLHHCQRFPMGCKRGGWLFDRGHLQDNVGGVCGGLWGACGR